VETYKILIIPILAGLTAQISKVLVDAVRTGTVNLNVMNAYGGMPSSHTAIVVSLTTVVALAEGLDSAAFILAFVFSLVTIRDAIGLRMYLSEHARILNKLMGTLPAKVKPGFPSRVLERIGHTPKEALMGGLVGLTASLIYWIVI